MIVNDDEELTFTREEGSRPLLPPCRLLLLLLAPAQSFVSSVFFVLALLLLSLSFTL